jgi:hypothetical protein
MKPKCKAAGYVGCYHTSMNGRGDVFVYLMVSGPTGLFLYGGWVKIGKRHNFFSENDF